MGTGGDDLDLFTPAKNPSRKDLFTPVNNNSRKRPSAANLDNNTKKIALQNRFTPLADSGHEAMQVAEEHQTEEARLTQKKNMPPVIIKAIKIDHAKVVRGMTNLCKSQVHIKYINENQVKVHTTTEQDFRSLTNHLTKKSIQFQSFTPKNEKPKKLVMKGLPEINNQDIIDELKTHDVICTEISIIKKKDAPMPAFPTRLLTFENKTDISKVKKIRYISYTKVTWQEYVNKKGTSQCHRCQLPGHGSRYCNLLPACVKCGQNHLTKDCTKPAEDAPRCVNCEGEHPASYSGCPKLIEYKTEMEKKKSRPTRIYRTAINSHQENTATSYAQILSRDSSPNLQKTQELLTELETLHSLCDIDRLLAKLKN